MSIFLFSEKSLHLKTFIIHRALFYQETLSKECENPLCVCIFNVNHHETYNTGHNV